MAPRIVKRRHKQFLLTGLLALLVLVVPLVTDRALAQKAGAGKAAQQGWELRILHASDQEAGKKALLDIPGMVAVMDQLNQKPYPNTLKLSSGDLFIAGPFLNASRYLYSNPSKYKPDPNGVMNPLADAPGLADIMINNSLGWDAAAIGNHEFDLTRMASGGLKEDNFFEQIASRPEIQNYDGIGISKDARTYKNKGAGIDQAGYPGTKFPYLSVNLDFNAFKIREGEQLKSIFETYRLVDRTAKPAPPLPNSLARSTVIKVGNSQVGVIGATTPFLPDIAGGLNPNVMVKNGYTPITTTAEQQAVLLTSLVKNEVNQLHQQGVNKIVLMTHLQDSFIEQTLSRELIKQNIDVDIVIGGGSHKVMAPADANARGMLRGPNQSSVIDRAGGVIKPYLIPYPEVFTNSAQTKQLYYVNSGSNYEYLNQLVVRFDSQGNLIDYDKANSRPWRTDGDGVIDMIQKPEWKGLPAAEQTERIKQYVLSNSSSPELRQAIDILNAVEAHINDLDRVQYGFAAKWLNGDRDAIRSRETNLGNLVADSMLWYARELQRESPIRDQIQSIDVAFVNGGGVRDSIGTEQMGPDDKIHRAPPESNPVLGKEEGEISRLDILNSLRFDNFLTVGSIPVEQLKRTIEAMIAKPNAGAFGQISGFSFTYRPAGHKGSKPVVEEIWLTQPALTPDGRVDGGTQVQQKLRMLYSEQKGFTNAGEQLGLVTINYLAEGAEGQADAKLTENIKSPFWIGGVGDDSKWTVKPQTITVAPAILARNLTTRDLGFGSYRDALAAYLEFNHSSKTNNPFAAADQVDDPSVQVSRIRPSPVTSPVVSDRSS